MDLKYFFDEPEGATVIQDQSGNNHHATLEGDKIVKGRQGNGLGISTFGATQVSGEPIDLSGNFVVHFWVLAGLQIGHPSQIAVYAGFTVNLDQVVQLKSGTNAAGFTLITIVKDGQTLNVYRNDSLADSYTIPSNFGQGLRYLIVAQYYPDGVFDDPNAVVIIDELTVYNNRTMSISEIRRMLVSQTTKISHEIDGVELRSLGFFVEKSSGILDRPAIKDPTSYDWEGEHGTQIDLDNIRYQNREIELELWFKGSTRDQAIQMATQLKKLVSGGIKRFLYQAGSSVIVNDVYFPDDIKFEIDKWIEGKTFGRVKLKMIDPYPVKRVFKFLANNTSDTVTMKIQSYASFNIFWGDGSAQYLTGVAFTGTDNLTHKYNTPGEYYISVCGRVDEINFLQTDALIVWEKHI